MHLSHDAHTGVMNWTFIGQGFVTHMKHRTAGSIAALAFAAAYVAPAAARDAASQAPAPAPSILHDGAPEIESDSGWSFKPRGRVQYDFGFTSVPETTGRSDGWSDEFRRIRLGASGDIPGGFGYKVEADFAGNAFEFNDALLTYKAGKATVSLGQMNTFQSLEELTSSLHTTMIERAAFTDAFGFERRVGLAVEVKSGAILAQAGAFTENLETLSDRNRSVDARLVYAPKLGDTQLHLGGSVHYADLETDSTVRYRQRPLVHFTDERFVDTRSLDAQSEFGLGLEGALIAGPVHVAAEGFWQNLDRPGTLADPTFFGGYAEAGVFLTRGDTRGYSGGKFDRTKPKRPVGRGGMGSVQLNVRYDYLDLDDAGVTGGRQNGYLVSLAWKPTAYTMLLANYGKLEYDDAVHPAAGGDGDYSVDAFGVRAQIDF